MNNFISGYTGIFNTLITDPADTFGVSLYVLADEDKKELLMVLLSPNCYTDAYRIIAGTAFENIKIFVPTTSAPFAGDFINLIRGLNAIHPKIKWVYPTVPSSGYSEEVKNLQIIGKFYQSPYDHRVSVMYIKSTVESYYDILIKEGHDNRYFCQYLNEAKLNSLYDDISIDEIHIPYNALIETGLGYESAIAIETKFAPKLYVYSYDTLQRYYSAVVNKIPLVPFVFNILNVLNVPIRNYQNYEDAQRNVDMEALTNYITETRNTEINEIKSDSITHNTSPLSHIDIRDRVDIAEAIARGKSRAKVFDLKADLDAWLSIPENVDDLEIGDNLWIRDLHTLDYWWDGIGIQPLESESPMFEGYYTKQQVLDMIAALDITHSRVVEFGTDIAALNLPVGTIVFVKKEVVV